MATTQARPYLAGSAEIKLEYGVAQTFALKFITGKNCGEAKFPPFGPRVLFTALDDRRLWLGGEDASDFEHALVDLGIQPADFIRVTKIKHPRGGGHSIRVERVVDANDANDADDAPAWVRTDPDMRHAVRMPPSRQTYDNAPSREEALLEKSVELARERGAAAFQRPPARISPDSAPTPAYTTNGTTSDHTPKPAAAHQQTATNNSDHTAGQAIFTTDAAPMLAAMCAAVDAIVETQAYAQRRGLGVTFSEESVRAIGLSIYIGNQRSAR